MDNNQGRRSASSYPDNAYRILCGNKYIVYRNEYAGHVFYKIPVVKTDNRDGANAKLTAYKNVNFRNKLLDCDIKDKTYIIPKKLFEDFYFKATDKYNPVWTVVITDWEVVQSEEQMRDSAIQEYQNSVEYTSAIDITDEDLPF